ncbi:MAG TPA: hypothetical protein VD846_07940 [Allosphingosinicella sp.]|nr:hypothetical protein [Allosphingosinicella sp.]
MPTTQSVPAVDSRAVTPTGRTLFRLTAANRNGTSRSDALVDSMSPGDPGLSLGFSASLTCEGSRFPDHVVFAPRAGSVSPRMRVVRVDPILDPHTLDAVLTGPGVGDPVSGAWVLSWNYRGPQCPPLDPTEAPPPGPTPAAQVGLRVTLECR